jgi:hypothetical protein
MIYAWLLAKNKFPVKRCRFIALLKDHSKTDALRERDYPPDPVFIYEFPVTTMNLFKIEMFLKGKVREYKHCIALKDDAIPPCTSEERWERPPKFAVMKTGQKRAVRLFDKREDADLFIQTKGENHYVEFRRGDSIRCRSFCLCKSFCNFYRETVLAAMPEIAITEESAAA